jgi:hypothetical protein
MHPHTSEIECRKCSIDSKCLTDILYSSRIDIVDLIKLGIKKLHINVCLSLVLVKSSFTRVVLVRSDPPMHSASSVQMPISTQNLEWEKLHTRKCRPTR